MLTSCLKKIVLISFALFFGCRHVGFELPANSPQQMVSLSDEIFLTFLPQKISTSYLSFVEHKAFVWNSDTQLVMFQENLVKNTSMTNVIFEALITEPSGKKRAFSAEKNDEAPDLLTLRIPYINPKEKLEITIKYDWMDIKNLPPIFLQTKENKKNLKVSIPFGAKLHYTLAHNTQKIDSKPTTKIISNNQWINHDNDKGQGTEFSFNAHKMGLKPTVIFDQAHFLQIFLGFESPFMEKKPIYLTSWQSVSSMIYEKLKAYFTKNLELKQLVEDKVKDKKDIKEKIPAALSILQDIKLVPSNSSFLFEQRQTIDTTFWKKSGHLMDIVLLAKNLLSYLDVSSEILLASSKYENPSLNDVYTPNLFSKPILALIVNNKIYYLDLSKPIEEWFLIADETDGQRALVISKEDGKIILLPKKNA